MACLEPLALAFRVRIIDTSAHTAPIRCVAPHEQTTLDANLDRLLKPNGLDWRRRTDGTIEVVAANASSLTLAPLDIEGDPLPELRRPASAVTTPLIEHASASTSLDARWLGTAPLIGFDQLSWYAPNVYGTGQSLAIRGTERSGDYFPALAVTFDGIDLGTRLLDDELVPLNDVTDLLLSRTPSSFEYGYAAQAGAIALRTAAPSAEPATSLALGAGNVGARNGEIAWSGPLAVPGLAATVAFDEHELPSFVRQLVVPQATVADRHNTFGRFKLRYAPESPDGLSAELSGLALSGDSSERVVVAAARGPGPGIPPAFIPFDRNSYALDPTVADTHARGAAGFVRYEDPANWTFDAHASFTTITRDATEFPGKEHWQDRELRRRMGFTASEHVATDWTFVAGVEYSNFTTSFHTPVGTLLFFSRFAGETASASAWIEHAWNGGTWNAGLGLRWLHERTSGDPTGRQSYAYDVPIPLATVEWRPAKDHAVVLSYGTGYRSGGSASARYLPERSRNIELAWRAQWLNGTLHSALSAFDGHVQDRFTYYAGGVSGSPLLGSVRDRGLEFELVADPTDRWRLRAGIGVLTSRYTSMLYRFGEATSEAPPQSATLGVRYGLADRWYGAVDAYRAAAANAEITGNVSGRLPAYNVLSARVGYRSTHWEESLTIANAFDADYVARVEGSANGRNPFGFRLGDPRRIEFRVKTTF